MLLSGVILPGQSGGVIPLLSPEQVVQINDNSLFTRRQELRDSTTVLRNLIISQDITSGLVSGTTDGNGNFTVPNPTGNANAQVFATPITQEVFGFPAPLHYEVDTISATTITFQVYSFQYQQFAVNQAYSAFLLILE
jgi:hypothetical protein